MIKAPNGTYIPDSTGNRLEIRTSPNPTNVYHHYWTNGQPTNGRLGINLIGWDSAGRPHVY